MEDNNINSRTITSNSELSFNLKYIANSQELTWYNKQEYPKKECDFCTLVVSNKESIQSLIKTNISLFQGHELFVSNTHGGEFLGIHLKHVLNIINENNDATIAIEGSKNAAIKNYHFNCHYISNKNDVPLTADISKSSFKEIVSKADLSIGILDTYGRNPIIIKSSSIDTLTDTFYALEKQIGVDFSKNDHPYINLIVWKEDGNFILAAIPRVVYKPTEYYDENNKWNIAPGVLEMSGIYLISNHDEYLHMTAEQLLQITDEVSYNDTHILELLKNLDLSKIN
ncbi:DUF4922 domain-containing protein [Labilibacter marinus]|uniref:DUF4922 domain-containing protein n=1 Tax=Labilibacter marinus TaxID=1477105 RepID=UPI00082FCCE7|nr:DUF4922 domain-containing protein [Labilibacter marinus]